MPVIQMTDISKTFGNTKAIDGLNLIIQKGEIFGFIGPNGAGKTTALRILMGILRASSGHAEIFSQDVHKDALKIHKRIAYVPGDVSLWDNLSGGEVIDLLMRLRKKENPKIKNELIKKFELDTTKKCRAYSKGNRQKIALIAAFASEPDLYIFDEPTSGLDPLMENTFRECVQKEQEKGKTVLLSSHILSEVELLCDKVGIIRQGKIIETGTLTELRHLTRVNVRVETARFIGGILSQEGVHELEDMGVENGYSFAADANYLGDIIKYISQFNIVNLECTPPSLEQLFISHYKNKGKTRP